MRASVLVVLLLVAMQSSAEEAMENSDEIPSMELLEFLAEWETADRQWLDPLEMESMPITNRSEGGDEHVSQ